MSLVPLHQTNGLKIVSCAIKSVASKVSRHFRYSQSDTDPESTSLLDKLLRSVIILYAMSLFVSTV